MLVHYRKMNILLVCMIVLTATGYDLTCPHFGHWETRAIAKCNSTEKYVCLWEENEEYYLESCIGPKQDRKGYRYVLNNGNFNRRRCASTHFQPFQFGTYGNSGCAMKKSLCNDEGQIFEYDGNSTLDRRCRCDYTKGYAFVSDTKNPCYCIPSNEDCSCYKKTCGKAELVSQDYDCINKTTMIQRKPKCSPLEENQVPPSKSDELFIGRNPVNKAKTHNLQISWMVLSMIIILTAVMLLIQPCYKRCKRRLGDVLKNSYPPYKSSLSEIKADEVEIEKWIFDAISNSNGEEGYPSNTSSVSEVTDDEDEIPEWTYNDISNSNGEEDIPIAIKKLSKEERDMYLEIIQKETEIRYCIRVMIVGKNGVGKTSLLARLLGKDIEGIDSTDGIDIALRRCKIRLRDGKWMLNREIDEHSSLLIQRIKKARFQGQDSSKIITTDSSHGSMSMRIDLNENANEADVIKPDTDLPDEAITTEASVEVIERPNSTHTQKQLEDNLNPETNTIDPSTIGTEEKCPQNRDTATRLILTDEVIGALDQLLDSIDSNELEDEEFIECSFWDFAGEKDYYATHQVFLNPYCVYLLVASLTDEIENVPTDVTYNSVGDHIEFWFDNIHLYGTEDDPDSSKLQDGPPVLFVCTKTDEYTTQAELDIRKDEYRRRLFDIVKQNRRKNLKRIIYLSNKEPSDEDFNELHKCIFDLGKDVKTFADKVPLKWIRLERSLEIVKESGTNILPVADVTSLALRCALAESEVRLFLKYYHNLGNLIYFERFKEYVILSHQWLADAFKCLVSDKISDDIKCTEEWRDLEVCGLLHESLISKLFDKVKELKFHKYKDHLLNVMEMFDIIVKPTTSSSYYMPCMIVESTPSVDRMLEICKIKESMRSPWLCLEFTSLPISVFNHVLVFYIRRHRVSNVFEGNIERLAIFHCMGVFYFDEFTKLILVFSKNKICVQVWALGDIPKEETYNTLLAELCEVIKQIKERYGLRINYSIKAMCSNGNIHSTAGQVSYTDITGKDKYACEEHATTHSSKDLFDTWLKEKIEDHGVSIDLRSCQSSEEENNFIKMFCLITGPAVDAIRHAFDQFFPPSTLDETLLKNTKKIERLFSQRRLTARQRLLLFPVTGSANSKEFDLILMIALLRNVANIMPPINGFDIQPLHLEISVGADIARIKFMRNKLAHSEDVIINMSDFNIGWTEMTNAIVRLGGREYEKICDELKSMKFEVGQSLRRSPQSSEEDELFLKMLKLIIGPGADAVRHIFHQYFPPSALAETLRKNETWLKLLNVERRLNGRQMQLLFPATGSPNSGTFTFQLMIVLLRNLTTITPPINGFDKQPLRSETSIGADIVRIKVMRTQLFHFESYRINISDFNKQWTDITKAIVRLGGQEYEKVCAEIMNMNSEF